MAILLFSESGAPLKHHYCVFGHGGAHPSLRGSYITKMRIFTVQAEAEGHWTRNRDPARSPLLQKVSTHSRVFRQRDPDDGPPRCKAHRARSPRTSDAPAVHVSSAAAYSPMPRSLLYDGRPPILPVIALSQNSRPLLSEPCSPVVSPP